MEESAKIQAWIEELGHHNPDVRCQAARYLGAWGDGSGLEALMDSLRRDADFRVRATAASSLGHHTHPEIVEALMQGLQDSADLVRQAAANVLAERVNGLADAEQSRVLPALLACLADPDASLRIKTALSLGLEQVTAAVPALIDRLVAEPDPEVCEAIVNALGWLKDSRAREALTVCLQAEDPQLRRTARKALSMLG